MKETILLIGLNLWKNINRSEPLELEHLRQLISNVIEIAYTLVGTVSLLFLVIGGFQYITAAGNPDNTTKAKSTLLYAVSGLILVIIAYAIVEFILRRF